MSSGTAWLQVCYRRSTSSIAGSFFPSAPYTRIFLPPFPTLRYLPSIINHGCPRKSSSFFTAILWNCFLFFISQNCRPSESAIAITEPSGENVTLPFSLTAIPQCSPPIFVSKTSTLDDPSVTMKPPLYESDIEYQAGFVFFPIFLNPVKLGKSAIHILLNFVYIASFVLSPERQTVLMSFLSTIFTN